VDTRFHFEWDVLVPYIGYYFQGLQVTLFLSLVALLLSLIGGLLLAFMSVSPLGALRGIAATYVWLFRAVPIYVYLLWVYYGLPILLGINISPVAAGLLCLGTQLAAFQSEVFRAGLQAISKGQVEAALSVGLSRPQAYVHVVLPQVLRLTLPPTGNNFVTVVKETSLVAIIGVFEITRYTQLAISYNFRAFEFYTALAVLYGVLVLLLSFGVNVLERRFALPAQR
jgi:His/Glu/Gln/Arg/opine family amino acid ABC transporter permease subunit